ncbi:SDR family oxidoreductase [Oceanobacillus salinisoli]|uniref:SDR family oxidoreductase n=1 Tax=Oceanobacillus salinisoli TaxID=2678611 RepID=UPI0012E2448E|nr:SDR family oxidoreductase [Oceanobacillus salinisoli]
MTLNLSQLKNKVIVITGASRGIGKATAEALHKWDVKLVLGARSVKKLSNEFNSENVLLIPLDVRDENSVQQFTEKAKEKFGRVDVLINTAGVGTFDSVLESKTEDFDDMLAVNLRGTYLTCKYFGRMMKEQQDGQILNFVSIAGTTALPGNGGYSASKFGVYGLTKVLQAELRREGIRITSVLPGSIDNSFWDDKDFDLDKSNMIPQDSIVEHISYLLCQPKNSVVDEITIMPPYGIL